MLFAAAASLAIAIGGAGTAVAQPADTVGVRAQGMGGAFTAVADDATASWWNPAGMASGAYFNALLEGGNHHEPSDPGIGTGGPAGAWRAETRSFAVAFPALGLSYYRMRFSEIQPQTSTDAASAGRQDGGATQLRLRSMLLTQFGVSAGQSLGSHLVIASTLKLLTAGAASQVQVAALGSLDTASSLDTSGDTEVSLDVGAMAVIGRARIGVMVRNVSEPGFGSGIDAFTLNRQIRVGGAVSSGSRGVLGRAVAAFDADLTRTLTVLGEERRIALGAEGWTSARTIGIRAGVGVNTIGEQRTSLSGGASVAVKRGIYVDGELTGGTDPGRHGWSGGLRVTF
jgi:hypothetical protein